MTNLASLLSKLEVHSARDEHKEVLQTALQVLAAAADGQKANPLALKRALVANIQMDNYAQAFQLIQKFPPTGLEEQLKLELAYVYYKLNKGSELLSLSQTVQINVPFKHILAQYYYRSGEESKALEIYDDLLSQDADLEDIAVNQRAVITQLKLNGGSSGVLQKCPSFGSYDELFNDALIDIVDSKYSSALEKLAQTKSIIQSSADLSREEIDDECLPIDIQIGYIYYLQGNIEESQSLLKSLDTKSQDLNLIINNNLLASSTAENNEFLPTLLYREMDFPNSVNSAKSKLSYNQEQLLQRNQFLLGKLARKSTNPHHFDMSFKYNKLPQALYHIDDLTKINLKKLVSKADQNIGLALLATQFAIQRGNNYQYAANILEKLFNQSPDLLLFPGLGKTLFAIYESLDQKNKMSSLLSEMYDQLMFNPVDPSLETYAVFVSLKLMSIDEVTSKALLEKYSKSDITDVDFTQGEVDALIGDIDTDDLISNGVQPLIKERVVNASKVTKAKVKRHQKPRLPKRMDPKGTIDAERWLPLKDRSNYKPKKGKRDTQG